MTITGHTAYKGLTAQQHELFVEPFRKFLPSVKPKQILEIGVAGGGTTHAVHDIMTEMGEPFTYRAYEVHDQPYYNQIRSLGVDLRLYNIFDHSYLNLNPDTVNEVETYIHQPGTTLILCDGGCKIYEFKLLSDFLKSGDYIMCHDYSESWEYFKTHMEHKIWDWCEIHDEHIQDAIDRNQLEKYMKEDFQAVAWGCFRKP